MNTHLSLFRFRRLPYGVASAPALFQSVMDQILKGIPGTACYLDDVLIAGRTRKECAENTERVLEQLKKHGIRANAEKCKFFQSSVKYLEHEISSAGLKPTKEKVEAILKAPEPKNVGELRAFLGLLNFYAKFLPCLAETLEPVHKLLRKENQWNWSQECKESFQCCKKLLCSDAVLELYDAAKPLKLT